MTSATILEERPVVKKGRPRKPTGEGTQVRIDSDLASMARYVASIRGLSLVEYLSAILRPAIVKDVRAAGRELEGKQ